METSKLGKSVYVRMGVWYDEKTEEIHLTAPETKWLHTTVNNDAGSKRYHANLFWKLARVLKEGGAPGPEIVKAESEAD